MEPMILPSFEAKVYSHIREHIENDFQSKTLAINGMPDHLHILVRLSQHIAIMDLLKILKENQRIGSINRIFSGRNLRGRQVTGLFH
jgi:REP element-mobilizing transposase RayT